MKTLFEEYKERLPEDSIKRLKPMLDNTLIAHFPRDERALQSTVPKNVIVVTNRTSFKDIFSLFENGYSHFVQETREDFSQELLASAFMINWPQSFANNPIPFFFNGFQSAPQLSSAGRQIRLTFSNTSEKPLVLERLSGFLDNSAAMASLKDICLQSADELINNAIFSAPIRPSGIRPNKQISREQEVEIPFGKKATLFACFSDQRLVIGCVDHFGSLELEPFTFHLRSVFKELAATVRVSDVGAGLGFKYLISNSANFYVLVDKGQRTLVVCGFLLSGLKANLSAAKHFHFSFR